MNAVPLKFTVLTSSVPDKLAKVMSLALDGSLCKVSAGSMVAGIARQHEVKDLAELAQVLERLASNEAVTWGVCGVPVTPIVRSSDLPSNPGAIARTREHFWFRSAPGIMMLDHDGAQSESLDGNAFRARLIKACPALADAPMLWRPSASAGIVTKEGQQLSPLSRHRLYIPVTDASMIPEAGKRLVAKLWAAGFGWFEVGSAGQALERTLVDSAVWQPERLDFAASPILLDGLHRPGVDPIVYGDPSGLFDLAKVEVSSSVEKLVTSQKSMARMLVSGKCQKQKSVWLQAKEVQLAEDGSISVQQAREVLQRACESGCLVGDFVLTASNGRKVRVNEILDEPAAWDNARFADPLDPDADLRVAVVRAKSGKTPCLYTHRHGGMLFDLIRGSVRVQVGQGMRVQTTDAVLDALRSRAEIYEFGEGALAYVCDGRARPVTQEWLVDYMGRVCSFYSVRKSQREGDDHVHTPQDASPAVARAILAKHDARRLPRLVAVITAPTLRLDGSIIDMPGHDEQSGLLYVAQENAPTVGGSPTLDEALGALAQLWEPFAQFPLIDETARGVVLHGIFSAVLRATLPTAPGIALDAPAAGTGKTLLASCIGALATGASPSILPPTDNDEETRKRLFSTLRDGARVILWDNVRDPLGGAALDAFLTASTFADRVLGASEISTLPNRALFIATGNNIQLLGDTCRRVFVARLDARSERPHARDFLFNPLIEVKRDRQRLVAAVLTIVRAYISAGKPKAATGRTASFEEWDDLVRQPLCWLARAAATCGRTDLPTFSDPLGAADVAFAEDPESAKHRELLLAWHRNFGSAPTTVQAAVSAAILPGAARSPKARELLEALEEIAGRGPSTINPRVLGKWIERYKGRRFDGLWFKRCTISAGRQRWAVEREPAVAIPPEPTISTTNPLESANEANEASVLVGLVDSGGFEEANS